MFTNGPAYGDISFLSTENSIQFPGFQTNVVLFRMPLMIYPWLFGATLLAAKLPAVRTLHP